MTGMYRKFSKMAAAAVSALLCALSASAQNSFTVDAPAVVSTDEIFRVVFTATYEGGKVSDYIDQFSEYQRPELHDPCSQLHIHRKGCAGGQGDVGCGFGEDRQGDL